MAEIDEMYSEWVLELFRNPLNKVKLKKADSSFKDVNPFCGDVIEIQLKIENKKVKEVGFQGQGCAISQAAASILTEIAKGKTVKEILKMKIDDVLRELYLESIKNNPVRIKCAALSLKVLKMTIYKYLGEKKDVKWESVVE